VATRALGPAALWLAVPAVLAVLAGCGGGGGASPSPAAADPAAAVEEGADTKATTAAGQPAAPAPPAAPKIDQSLIPEPGTPIVRETYSYTGGSRDPFASVLDAPGLGPELADLDLLVIIYQERDPSASVAVLRDRISMKRYTIREGDRLGRSRVSAIRAKDVTFTIDDYGTERQVTLALRKQETKP